MFENWVLKRIFERRRVSVTMEWRKLHFEELNFMYCSPHIVRVMKWEVRSAGHVARIVERCIQDFGGETGGQRATCETQA